MKVYVVTWVSNDGEGELHGVFSTREPAEMMAHQIGGDLWEICGLTVSEMTVDEPVRIDL